MFKVNKNKKISLKDIDNVVMEWRKTCSDRGEMALGLYSFVSIDPKKLEYTENHNRVFGESNILKGMLEFLKSDLDDRVNSAQSNKKCDDNHVHA